MYMFLIEAIFTYTLAVYMFRAGVRRNNTDVIMASRVKYSPPYTLVYLRLITKNRNYINDKEHTADLDAHSSMAPAPTSIF